MDVQKVIFENSNAVEIIKLENENLNTIIVGVTAGSFVLFVLVFIVIFYIIHQVKRN